MERKILCHVLLQIPWGPVLECFLLSAPVLTVFPPTPLMSPFLFWCRLRHQIMRECWMLVPMSSESGSVFS